MSETFELNAQLRSNIGTQASRRLRQQENLVPGTVYGAEKEPQSIAIDHKVVIKALANEAFYSHILTLKLAGDTQKVILKTIQRHPSKPKILHMDFFRISEKEKLTMNIPIHFLHEEEAVGVKEGGIVSRHLNELEIRCLPADLPEFIEIDLANLGLDESIHLNTVTLPKAVESVALSHDQNPIVVSIHLPRMAAEPEEIAAPAPEEAEAEAEAKAPAEGKEGEEKKS